MAEFSFLFVETASLVTCGVSFLRTLQEKEAGKKFFSCAFSVEDAYRATAPFFSTPYHHTQGGTGLQPLLSSYRILHPTFLAIFILFSFFR